jgi:hypothetical protein
MKHLASSLIPNLRASSYKSILPEERILRTQKFIYEQSTDIDRWSDHQNFPSQWSLRAKVASKHFEPSWRILDIGCGSMELERELPNSAVYVPADIVVRDSRTIICDLNNGCYPNVEADCVVLLGVLEYIHLPQHILSQIALRWPRLLLSYNCAERDAGRNRLAHGWFNSLRTCDILDTANDVGFFLQSMVPFGDKERIFFFHSGVY